MKVLSLTEPYATLILNGCKSIETRSWKTNYRGELYIHASSTKISKESLANKELMGLVENASLNFGDIICKCNLVDCIYMTKDYVEKMKNDNYQEYICGEYSEGRYAWILKDVKPLDIKIKAKGQLNIWDFYSDEEIMELMNNIEYGWIDKNNYKHKDVDNSYDNYVLQSPKDVIKNKIGVCLDQVELERYYFKSNDLNVKTYSLVHYDGDKCPMHTFLTYEKEGKHYWFEHAWEMFRGIHEYDSLKELLFDVQKKFINYELNGNYEEKNLCLYQYKKPKYNIGVMDFYKHCEEGKTIDLINL